MPAEISILVALFFLTALTYSIAGFGGGSTYIALLALWGVSHVTLPSIALVCNLIVVSGGCYFAIKQGHLSLKHVLPFVIPSFPLAYLGARIPLSQNIFLTLLGIALLVAALRLFLPIQEKSPVAISNQKAWGLGLPLGAGLGFLSGLTGIGGGIYLAPIFYLLRWAPAKTIAASASFFILVNSFFGLIGQLTKSHWSIDVSLLWPLAIAVFLGGQIGSRLTFKRFPLHYLKYATASLVLFVSLRILFQVWRDSSL